MLSHSFLVFTVNTNSNLVKEPRYTSQCDSALKLKLYKVMYKHMPNRCIYHGREKSWIFQPPRCLIHFSVVNTDIKININIIGRAGASPPSRTAAIIFLYIYILFIFVRTSCPKSSTCFVFSDISIFLRRK